MAIIVWFLLSLGVADGLQEAAPLHVPMETFQFEDFFFTFYNQRANWLEAFTICRATHARLAVINTKARADFLARVITDTSGNFQEIWIGGMFMKDQWMWAPTGHPIHNDSNDAGYPPWDHVPTHRGKNCLAFDRKGFEKPMFIELRCMMQKAFVCEKSVVKAIDNYPQMGIVMTRKDTKYIAYHARVTWEEALAFCRQTGAILATIPDLKTAYFVVGIMRRSRPELEDLWIGGQYLFNNWVWLSNNTVIPNTSMSTGYPPWKNNQSTPLQGKDCLLIDHHACKHDRKANNYLGIHARRDLCEEPMFMETECSRRKPFICEKRPDISVKVEVNASFNGTEYLIVTHPETWETAYNNCISRNMSLANVDSEEKLTFVVNVVTEETLSGDGKNLWLGGKYTVEKDMWAWSGTNKTIPGGTSSEFDELFDNPTSSSPEEDHTEVDAQSPGSTTEATVEAPKFPPWCMKDNELKEDQCLNLDHGGESNASVFYGMDCNTTQAYVCEKQATKDFVAMGESDSVFIAEAVEVSFKVALQACMKKNMILAMPHNLTEALKVAQVIPKDTMVWVGGSREDGTWTWKLTGEVIPDTRNRDGFPPWESLETNPGNQCLAVKSTSKEWPLFVEVPCDHHLLAMCQTTKEAIQGNSNSINIINNNTNNNYY